MHLDRHDHLDRVAPAAPAVVRPHESGDPVAAVLEARQSGARLALATSGTSTGVTREVLRSTDSWWDSFAAYGELARLSPRSRLWVPGPLRSTMNLFAAVHARWLGATSVGRPEDATHACLTPAQLDLHLRDLPRGTNVVVAGAHLPEQLWDRAVGGGLRVDHYYGAAELSFVAWGAAETPGELRPFPGAEVQIRQAPVERTVWVRSPYLCDGYAGPTGAMRVDADGWATVGDLGTLEGGALTVLGRPDAVVTAGATVLVADVEAVLRPVARGDFAVHASPHERLGQVVTVTLVDGGDRARLEQHAREHLPPSHRPRRWRVADVLPLTSAGKVDRSALEVDEG